MMNKNKLTALIHKISKEKNVSFNILLQLFFFERFLNRLSCSKYKDFLVLKGGFLLSSLLGITQRSTIDMDFNVSNMKFNKETMIDTIQKIISVDLQDDILFQISDISNIMEKSASIGYQVSIIGTLDNIKVHFHIDLATGDPITPDKIEYKYQPLIEGEVIKIMSYTVETVLAEKLQTIMDKRTGNSRMKDFFDIYILMKMNRDMFNVKVLNTAIKITFDYRKTTIEKESFKEILIVLGKDDNFVDRWNNYTNKNYYVDDIDFMEVQSEIMKLIDFIE